MEKKKLTSKPVEDTVYVLCCAQSLQPCPTLCDPMDCSMLGSSILHYLPQFAQIYAHWVSDAILCHSSSATPFSFGL